MNPQPVYHFTVTSRVKITKYIYTLLQNKGSVIFYQEGAPKNWGGSGTLSKIKRGDQKIFSN